MDEAAVERFIGESFAGVEVVKADGGVFFFFDPEKKFPFATIVTSDAYDQVSNLNREGVYRLNVGVGKKTFQEMFGAADVWEKAGWDFARLDTLMPHPVYGKMYWVCVLNPSAATFERVRGFLSEAYETAVRRLKKGGGWGE